ncbi:NrfD/PsrC family molybdoenzyme membrane anchor subunit [Actinomycetospora cinnamomea]|uniref:Formate-dependent nitrite reductase membrane component NrfD n=1 Tax=Actinomycetospora cinnamomea TaxID=663609 RepID=A0A2U1F8H7_9PSEU|nr:NrfD/PsrC family molybdoenzyme membrane anchor subunit [Actinomycetospora cinnamomea]PVZ08290.1 formate-dependent nitrite reductase membrane component NrfD [Actinomycetospora cinnamomea]
MTDANTEMPERFGHDRGDDRDRGSGKRRGRKGEQLQVPEADFRSYYGRPIIKAPVWKNPDVPLYLFLGGLAGTSAGLGALGAATGRPTLRRTGRLAAAGGAVGGTAFLVHDLHRPSRFLHMLRVLKPTSPLSVGTWILSPFATFAAATAASEVTGLVRRAGDASGVVAAVIGPALATYTAVLFSNTAVPTWHEAHRELPIVFAGSAAAAGGGMGLVGSSVRDNLPAARLAVGGAAVELVAGEVMERRLGLLGDVYGKGRAGVLMKASKACLAAGAVGAVLGRRRRWSAALSGLALMAGSALTRFGVFDAGIASANDPAHIVVPQRERIRARQATNQVDTAPSDRAFA